MASYRPDNTIMDCAIDKYRFRDCLISRKRVYQHYGLINWQVELPSAFIVYILKQVTFSKTLKVEDSLLLSMPLPMMKNLLQLF